MKITKRIIQFGSGCGVIIDKSFLRILKMKKGDILELDIKRAKIE